MNVTAYTYNSKKGCRYQAVAKEGGGFLAEATYYKVMAMCSKPLPDTKAQLQELIAEAAQNRKEWKTGKTGNQYAIMQRDTENGKCRITINFWKITEKEARDLKRQFEEQEAQRQQQLLEAEEEDPESEGGES